MNTKHIAYLVKKLEDRVKLCEVFIECLTHVSIQNSSEEKKEIAEKCKRFLEELNG